MKTKSNQQLALVTHNTQLNLDGLQDFFQAPRLSKPEMHLLLKPFFMLDRHADRFKPIEYNYSVVENGRAITRGWNVQPHFKFGLPGPFDRDVTTVIYEMVNELYFAKSLSVPETMVIGTFRDFAERLGIAVSGQNVAAIKDSLKRLMNTLAVCEETFFDNKKHRYISASFRLLKGVGFAGDEDGNGGKHEENFIVFDECILRNLNTGYVMVVDVDCLRTLKTNIAKQLYAHLSYRFFVEAQDGIECWTADYEWLSVHLGIKRWTELWRAKQQLHDAHEELKELGYIRDYRWDGWRVLYRPGALWKGEQLRRNSGKAKRKRTKQVSPPIEKTPVIEPHDPLIVALSAFASGLSMGEDRIQKLGLTVERARELCLERNIPLRNS